MLRGLNGFFFLSVQVDIHAFFPYYDVLPPVCASMTAYCGEFQEKLLSKKAKALSKKKRKMQELEKQMQEKDFERAFFREFWPDNV